MTRKLKIYLDTSVINFLFADDAQEYQKITIDFFEHYLDDYQVWISNLVITEIDDTLDDEKKKKLQGALLKYSLAPFKDITNEVLDLANEYILNNVIPEKSYNDAVHIAYATVFDFDILLSWNFKHIANFRK